MSRNIVGPLVRGQDLFGRGREIATAWRLLEHGSVLLAAPRRYGKSSLMSGLADAPPPGWSIVVIDIEAEGSPQELVTKLAAELLQHEVLGPALRSRVAALTGTLQRMAARLDEVGVGVAGLGEARLRLKEAAPPGSWREVAEQLFASLARAEDRVVVVLDEFPIFVTTLIEQDRDTALGFLRWFRALRQREARVRFLVGGSVNIEPTLELLGETATINDLQRLPVDPFEPQVALDFVRTVLTTERVEFDDDVPHEVCLTVGTAVPFFLQVLMSELIGRGRISKEHVREAYQRRVLGPDHRTRFAHYESRLKTYGADEDAARRLLTGIARGVHDQATLADRVRHRDLPWLLARLEADYYLARDGHRWRFHSSLLRDWWLRNARIPEGS